MILNVTRFANEHYSEHGLKNWRNFNYLKRLYL